MCSVELVLASYNYNISFFRLHFNATSGKKTKSVYSTQRDEYGKRIKEYNEKVVKVHSVVD